MRASATNCTFVYTASVDISSEMAQSKALQKRLGPELMFFEPPVFDNPAPGEESCTVGHWSLVRGRLDYSLPIIWP